MRDRIVPASEGDDALARSAETLATPEVDDAVERRFPEAAILLAFGSMILIGVIAVQPGKPKSAASPRRRGGAGPRPIGPS